MKLDFSIRPIVSGKKLMRLAIPCSEEYLKALDLLAGMVGETRATLAHKFVLEGMQKTLGVVFMAEPHQDKKLRELLEKR